MVLRFAILRFAIVLSPLVLSACAAEQARVSDIGVLAQIELPKGVSSGFIGIDGGDYNRADKKNPQSGKAGAKANKAIFALDNLLGSGFDPNTIKAPDYKKAQYKSQLSKQFLLEELMDSAYDAYKEVSGKNWYPKRVAKATRSGDILLRGDRWLLRKGADLQDILTSWGRKAQWQIVWRSEYEYPVRIGAVFKGSFPKAVGDMLASFQDRDPKLYATFYKNRVVIFQNEGVE